MGGRRIGPRGILCVEEGVGAGDGGLIRVRSLCRMGLKVGEKGLTMSGLKSVARNFTRRLKSYKILFLLRLR